MNGPSRGSNSRAVRVVAVAEEVPCRTEVAEEEALLRDGGPAVRVAVLADRALSVGVAVPELAPWLARARAEGIPVVRRSSGGTGVLHAPGDLAWSLVLPRDHPLVGRDFVGAYGRLGGGAVRFLAARGRAASWVPAPGLSAECCLLGERGQVLVVAERILGGAAQHADRAALLHHGILPFAVDRAATGRLFGLPSPGPVDRLVGLADLGFPRPAFSAVRALAASFAEEIAAPGRDRTT